MEENKDINFIARHYRSGLFGVEPTLRRIKPMVRRWWTPVRIAAASAAIVVLGATAAVIIRHNTSVNDAPAVEHKVEPAEAPQLVVKVIDFENTPLPVVVKKIHEVYGVEVTGLPDNADDYLLSLHYEGSATDLVDTINEILDLNMKVISQ